MSMTDRLPVTSAIAMCGLLLVSCAAPEGRLTFERETQNLRFRNTQLQLESRDGVTVGCETVTGDAAFGLIPHRQAGEQMTSRENFLHFAAIYGEGAPPVLFVDLDGDRDLSCAEEVPLLKHPKHAGTLFRTLTLNWTDDGAGERSQRYRINLPAVLTLDPEGDRYSVELVDVPVARWNQDGTETVWVLYDGNHDGIFDQGFGDAILVDSSGEGRMNLDPYSENFFSFHAPVEVPWGVFTVADVDRGGRYLQLSRVDAEAEISSARRLGLGDAVPDIGCNLPDGSPVSLGGASGRYQLAFFWLSHCEACTEHVRAINALLPTIDRDRLTAVGVSLDGERSDYDDFVAATQPDWPQCFVGKTLWDNRVARRFGVQTPSDFVLIDPGGALVMVGNGFDQLQESLVSLQLEQASESLEVAAVARQETED